MVKRCALLIVIFIILFITSCSDTEFWCDYCHTWYHGESAHYVTEGTVDFILCEECYKQFLYGNLHHGDGSPSDPEN